MLFLFRNKSAKYVSTIRYKKVPLILKVLKTI
jgi:hypothetical protein